MCDIKFYLVMQARVERSEHLTLSGFIEVTENMEAFFFVCFKYMELTVKAHTNNDRSVHSYLCLQDRLCFYLYVPSLFQLL